MGELINGLFFKEIMNKFYAFVLFFLAGFSASSQEFPGRRTLQDNGIKPLKELPVISGKETNAPPRFKALNPDVSRRVVVDEETGAVSYIRNLQFSGDAKNARRNIKEMSLDFLQSVKSDLKVANVKEEFRVLSDYTDKDGTRRVNLQQNFKGVPLYGGELGLHSNRSGVIEFMMGKVFPTPQINPKPRIGEEEAIRFAYSDLSKQAVIQKNGLVNQLLSMDPDRGELFIYPGKESSRLIYHLTLRPNLLERWVYFVDAHTGEVIEKYNHTCTLDGVVQASSRDLNNVQQAFHAYQIGNQYVMVDTRKKMFRPGESQLPNSPVGAILTIDAKNARVDNEDMDLYHVVSSNPAQWNATAVSAHVNASRSYDYYEQKFQRLSLNGNGGNIISVINITDEDGKGFDNAFWNGVFMGYGNGGQAFKPLAGSLDVAGHEMTHGVIENTAKLEYRNQSGALNESFADIFGTMIDRDDWTLGEDVVNRSAFPSGALRSLQNPNQGGRNDPGYQPMYMSQYVALKDTPEQDNGGVHVNSGIPNHAFYLFATGTGMDKDKAENVYYHALTRYLGRTSRFPDLRLAVIQSAKDLYGEGVVTQAARAAFDKVGILESGTGTVPNPSKESEVPVNPGLAQIVAFGPGQNDQRLYLANFNFGTLNFTAITGQVGCLSKPSITDNGEIMVFVGNDQKIYAYDLKARQFLNFNDGTGLKWHNAAISKDGKRIAAIADETKNNNYIYVYDLVKGTGQKFELYNPTYSSGVNSGKVLYAEALEWDLSGEYVVYDARTQISGWFSQSRTFYDVGILRAWNPIRNTYGDGAIEKIFRDVPEGVSLGNPALAKTNSGILALDYIDTNEDRNYIVTLDLNRAENSLKAFETSTIGYPDFSKNDEHLTFNYLENNRYYLLGVKLAADKITPDVRNAVTLAADKVFGVSFANGTRTLPQVQEQKVSISPIPDKNPGVSFDISATASSGLSLIYKLVSGNASISGRRLTLGSAPGKVQIEVIQLGDSRYAPASAQAEFCIVPPAPVLTDNGNQVVAGGGTLYQFFVNGNPLGGYTSKATLRKDFDGTYSVKSVTQDGCMSVFSNVITYNRVLANEDHSLKITISPNPVTDVLSVKIPEGEVLESMEILDNTGSSRISSKALRTTVSHLPSGIYLLKAKTDRDTYSVKMVKL